MVWGLRATNNGKQVSTNGEKHMSGGHFDYAQYKIGDIADSIEQLISKDEDGRYTEETIVQFCTALWLLRRAQIYAQRIDWLVSCDDGEDSFHKRLAFDLAAESNAAV
jgi:hypothetical protein